MAMIAFVLVSCEEEYTPDTVFEQADLVVEGYVENGVGALPPYVVLTRSSPYLTTLDSAALNALFVHGAEVYVSDGQREVRLTEVCASDLAGIDTALANSFLQSIGVGAGQSSGVNFCVYIEIDAFLSGQSALDIRTGGTYTLRVEAEGKTVRSTTTLVPYVPIDSFMFLPHADFPANDSLVQLYGFFTDPAQEENYYRIFTKRNREPMYPATSLGTGTSVTDDKIFNGQSFQFDVLRGQPRTTAEFDFETFGYFWRGDTIVVRGATLDKPHFRFWQTMEFNTGREGPFTSYVRIQSNIEGGLGIWGGVSFEDYVLVVR